MVTGWDYTKTFIWVSKFWEYFGNILEIEVTDTHLYVMFYGVVVYNVLLYGSDTCVITIHKLLVYGFVCLVGCI